MRLDKLLYDFESEQKDTAAHVAIMNDDGSVTVKLPNDKGTFDLPSEDAFRAWKKDNNMKAYNPIEVVIVKSEGKMPEVK